MKITARKLKDYPWYLQPFFWNQRRKYGAVLDAALLWARVPKLFIAVALLYGVIDRKSSPLNPVLRALVTIKVSQINGCAFCVDINSATLLKRGVSMDKLEALPTWRDSGLFDEGERVALEVAEKITRTDLQVDDDCMALLRQHFDEDEIVELTGLIAFQNMSSKFNSALGVPSQGFCKIPPSEPR
ncbi:MAG: carboxymuconolactone decarboxylase family protein [Nitrospinaceae bacterium]